MSNVDLADQFTNMITTQRGYQANSRIITVSDTMLEELINLKRYLIFIGCGQLSCVRSHIYGIRHF